MVVEGGRGTLDRSSSSSCSLCLCFFLLLSPCCFLSCGLLLCSSSSSLLCPSSPCSCRPPGRVLFCLASLPSRSLRAPSPLAAAPCKPLSVLPCCVCSCVPLSPVGLHTDYTDTPCPCPLSQAVLRSNTSPPLAPRRGRAAQTAQSFARLFRPFSVFRFSDPPTRPGTLAVLFAALPLL